VNTLQERRPFRPDIEGLRAVAVLAVVLFHAGLPALPGGFVGVDVFFVVSGFLITGMLWREVEATGTVRLSRFYAARARRLLPAGTAVLVVTAVASAWLLPPLQARAVLGDGVAAALYAGNYRLALQGTDYLAADTPPSPFQHYWSLGVEEQFYLIWPALLILTAWAVRRFLRPRGVRAVGPYVAVLAVVTVASFAIALWWTRTQPPWAFFSLPSRAWELAAGGLVALTTRWWSRLPSVAAALSSWGGLALIGAASLGLDESTPYPGVAALLPVLGTVLVVGGGCAASRGGAGTVLATAPLRWIGRVSYSWYLWHWPVFLLLPHLLGRPLGLGAALSAAVLSAGLAMLTLQVIEEPARFARAFRGSTARSLLLGGATTATGLVAGLVLLTVVPVPVGHGAAAAETTLDAARAPATPAAPAEDPRDAVIRELTAQVQAAVAASVGLTAVPSNLSPSLADAQMSKQQPFVDGCVLTWTAAGLADCSYGDPAGPVRVTLFGDSHAAQWEASLEAAAQQQHWRVEVYSKVTCPPLDLPISSPYLERRYTECEQWRARVLDRLRSAPPTLVVLAMVRRYTPDFGFASFDAAWTESLGRTVAGLRAMGSSVLVLGGIPDPHGTVPTCLSDNLANAAACLPTRAEAMNDAGTAAEQAAVEAAGGSYADLTPLFCTDAECPLVVGNTLVFRDSNHLSKEYAALLGPVISAVVSRSLPVR
jgi:peptidoglycan/LPS O-acetylase OafA/YrhL